MSDHRTLVVHISSSVIGDGEIAAPRVGAVLTGPLRFVELPDTEPDIVTIKAILEPSGNQPILQQTGQNSSRRWEWTGLLRGEGWTASWRGFIPRTGRVELTGRFLGVFGYDTEGRFRGRVTRAQLVSERYHFVPGEGWEIAPGQCSTRDVVEVERFFGHEPMPDDNSLTVDQENNVMVTLDLDDVPPLPTRPSIVPGDVAAAGGVTWVLDAELPLVVGIDTKGVVAEHVLPAKVGGTRSIWATDTGCWVGGVDGMFWIPRGQEAVRIDSLPAHVGAVNDDRLLVCTGDPTWRMYTPGSGSTDVTAIDGYVNSIAAERDAWIVCVQPRGESVARLVRVTSAGQSTIGPIIPQLPRGHGNPFLAGDPVRLIRGVDVAVVEPDLGIRDDGEQLRRSQFHGGQLGGFAWTIGHPPDGTSSTGWWPLPGPVHYERTEQFWLFTVYDATTLTPLTSAPVFATRPNVAADDTGRILVIARGVRVVRHDDPVLTQPSRVDVARMLTDSREGVDRTNPT
ncbi:hypothetical protein CH275_07085 [Rhodococcus sp. 06-235-1A]|uniref:hypothetical protein n=1 Tax=Rhodococcus sp. 06-235-1A TaxID=2022508 RepID=UPI000B9BE860|nr:hypothetical protein [Rhodococcus sp. 06-235-1A]OZD06963.1 hypothetical protein CH275_07085 [Rhodococcus sp. 06-235-1A]